MSNIKDNILPQDNQSFWLNEWGKRYWVHKDNPHLYTCRPYWWVNKVHFIDETNVREDGSRERKCVSWDDCISMEFTTFMDLKENHWIPIDIKYERKQKLEKLNGT